MNRPIAWLLAVLLLVACTRQSTGAGSADRDTITEEEIAASSASNAYEAVQKLRGNFLSNRGKTTIQSIRLYRAWDAQQRYGNDVMGGVIEVTTKK